MSASRKSASRLAASRLTAVFGLEFRQHVARVSLWILVVLLGFTAYGLSSGNMRINTGDTSVGGTKAWITSQFSNAYIFSVEIFLFYAFFVTVAAGLIIMRDDELKVGEVVHATALRASEYVWGKFTAVLAAILCILALHVLLTIFFNHAIPNAKAEEFRGPLVVANYLVPAIVFGLPTIVFLTGAAFAVGEYTRKPILIFFLPVALLLLCGFFAWTWSPSWLDPRLNRLIMVFDPSGFRWLNETWLKVDRGVQFYNKAAIPFSAGFLVTRVAYVLAGLGAVALATRHFAATMRGTGKVREVRVRGRRWWLGRRGAGVAAAAAAAEAAGAAETLQPSRGLLASLGMARRPPGFVRSVVDVVRMELRELRSQAGLYLFAPLILIQVVGNALVSTGAMDTRLLLTPGVQAAQAMNTLTLVISLLILYYTVESLQRERTTGIAPIFYSTPVGTSAILTGKALANVVVGAVIMLAALIGCMIGLLVQHRVGMDLRPFLILWGLVLIPTLIMWSCFVMAVFALVGNRYTAYSIGLAAWIATGYFQMRGKMTWVTNWNLWSAVRWSDMDQLGLDHRALILNRVLVLGLAVFFARLALAVYPRGELDPTRVVHRSRPSAVFREVLRIAPYAAVPIVVGIILGFQVKEGFQGGAVKKKHKDYWKQNVATWREAPLPAIADVNLKLDIEPARCWFRTEGTYRLVNRQPHPLAKVPLTGALHWEKIAWTMNGEKYEPEDRSKLFVFTPPRPLAPGDSLTIGFEFEGAFPRGVTRNGGAVREFILPSGVVLTSFSPSFVPLVGYDEEIGVEEENKYEPRVYPDDFYQGVTEAFIGSGTPFTTHIEITAPAEYTMNSVGTLVSDEVQGGRRTVVWESDQPVNFFNVIGGRWEVKRGEGTAIYYYPGHPYNIEEMSRALEASRRCYSAWFMPYPWQELKISEFPDLARYAQGFPTNITFSEGIGFLTKSDPQSAPALVVTAHEASHQWWGNILMPGKGPGGNIVAEGLAHFSTILLMEEVKGARSRMEFAKRIESHYGDVRQADSERPLVKVDGSRAGDETVTYDKGGWVFWMLLQHMGRERALAGLRQFIADWSHGPDHAVLQDLVASLRPFAADSTAYDAFVKQWFHEVVVPEYRLSEAKCVKVGEEGVGERVAEGAAATEGAGVRASAGDSTEAVGVWEVTVRVENVGTGRMPVEVAAVRGDRFREKEEVVSPDYREARQAIVLGAKEGQDVTVRCGFKPERVVVDPDVLVLQLKRESAVARL